MTTDLCPLPSLPPRPRARCCEVRRAGQPALGGRRASCACAGARRGRVGVVKGWFSSELHLCAPFSQTRAKRKKQRGVSSGSVQWGLRRPCGRREPGAW